MVFVQFHKCHSGSHLFSQSNHMLMVVIKEAATCSPTDCTHGREPCVCLRSPGFLSSSAFPCIHARTHTCGSLFHNCARRYPSNVARAAIRCFGIGCLTLPREGTTQDRSAFPTVESVSLFESQKSVLCSGLLLGHWGGEGVD